MQAEHPSPLHRDALLLEFIARGADPAAVMDAVGELARELAIPPANLGVYRALQAPLVTAYLGRSVKGYEVPAIHSLARDRLRPFLASDLETSRLRALRAHAGAAAGTAAPFHYVVRTGVGPGGETELERWYDEEHMPGLAAVPGTAMAYRLVSLDAAPRYYAAYDLMEPEVLGSPDWLAVRGTAWSDRVRPTFRDTRRIMSRRIA